jgi:DNA-binding NarL/FixJ family response regulator
LWASRKVVADTLHLLRVPAVPDPDQQTLSGLSKRELEIVEWMRKGMTNKEIARAWHQRHDGQDACAEHLP